MWSIFGLSRIPKRVLAIERMGEYVYLNRKKRIVSLRKKRYVICVQKWKRVQRIVQTFRFIPTILLVGVTGGLAMDNAKKRDDIDIFFITRCNTIWITRLLVTVLADGMQVRRRPGDHRVSDKICLNMFISEDALSLPMKERDLFTAHEVLQMTPLWEREGVYKIFLTANKWVKYFLPNAWKEKIKAVSIKQQMANQHHAPMSKIKMFRIFVLRYYLEFVIWILRFLELPSRELQLWYMKKRRTNEVIRSGMIRFHPRDAREWVREKYAQQLGKWNIPLDKIFYHR